MIPIRVRRVGGLGNTMFQYMLAEQLRSLVPGAQVCNVSLPEFGLELPDVEMPEASLRIDSPHDVDIAALAHLLRSGVFDGVELGSYAQRLEYYSDRATCAALFPPQRSVDATLITENTLVINVRGREVLRDTHPDYGPVPVAYFEQIAQQTGLDPVLVGQLGDDPYSDEIRRRFPGVPVLESRSPAEDFELIRAATHLVFGVSTFSWLAGWLSAATRSVFMPISGIFDPAQRPDIDLLPVFDDRYRFYDLRSSPWTASPDQLNTVLRSADRYHEVSRSAVRARMREAYAKLVEQRLQTDPSALNTLRRQRDRSSRLAKSYSTRLTNVNGWARFLSQVSSSLLELPDVPPESEVLRVRLKADGRVQYRLRLHHQAEELSAAVDLPTPEANVVRADIERSARSIGAVLTESASCMTLIMPARPIDQAASLLDAFVDGTSTVARRDSV